MIWVKRVLIGAILLGLAWVAYDWIWGGTPAPVPPTVPPVVVAPATPKHPKPPVPQPPQAPRTVPQAPGN